MTQSLQVGPKTELIIFHSNSKKTNHSLKYRVDGKRLTQTDTVKYLGVLLEYHLLWLKQINHVATKINTLNISTLNKIRSSTFLKILKDGIFSFRFLPII